MGSEGAQAVIEIVRGAWQDYRTSGRPLKPGPRASYVWNCMIDRAEVEFANFEGVDIMPLDKSVIYVLHGHVAFRLKLLDGQHRTSNIKTRIQRDLQRSGSLQFDGMPVDLPIISCGYTLDETESEVDKVLAVRELNNRVEWWFELDELANGEFAPVSPIFPDLGPDLPSLPTIRRVKRGKDGGSL